MFQNMFLSRLLIMMKCRLIRKKKSKWLFNAHTAPDEHEIQCMQMLHLLDFMSIHYMQPHLTTLAYWYATYWALHSLGNYLTLGFHVVFYQIQGSRFHVWVEVGYLEGSRYVVDGSFDKAEDGKEARSCIDASGKSGIFCGFVKGSFARRILANDRWTGNM